MTENVTKCLRNETAEVEVGFGYFFLIDGREFEDFSIAIMMPW